MSLSNAAPTQPNEFPVTPVAPTVAGEAGAGHSNGRTFPASERPDGFVDRRRQGSAGTTGERRQFGSSHDGLSEAGRELALAIDQYKLRHRRRVITYEEMLTVIHSLGYRRSDP